MGACACRCRAFTSAILALLIGCGLRRGELLAISAASIQLREDHWVMVDLLGKAGHIRTVPIPLWAKEALDRWTGIVKKAAEAAAIDELAPHDLRRYAESRLCRTNVGILALATSLHANIA